MSYWTHRIIRRIEPNKQERFFVAEVYYNDDGSIFGYINKPVKLQNATVDDLKQTLHWCLECLDKPIINEKEITFKDNNGNVKKENF